MIHDLEVHGAKQGQDEKKEPEVVRVCPKCMVRFDVSVESCPDCKVPTIKVQMNPWDKPA